MGDYYDEHAADFLAETRDVDMSALRSQFIGALPHRAAGAAGYVLDAGSGSGRDARAFREAGLTVAAFDAAPAMVQATQAYSGVATRLMRFETFSWEHDFDGIWACASLLHVAEARLPDVLCRLAAHLVAGGVLYASFKLGMGERWEGGRRFTDMTEDRLSALLADCRCFWRRKIWRTPDARMDRSGQFWVNALGWAT